MSQYQHRMRVRYAEIDAQAVVFNGNYLTYFDVGITEACRSVGLIWKPDNQPADDFQLIRAEVDFVAPLFVDEEFDIGVTIHKIGRTSVQWQLEVKGTDAEVKARGVIVWVSVDLTAKCSREISATTRQKLAQLTA